MLVGEWEGVNTTELTEIGEDVEKWYDECKEDDADRSLVHEELRCAGGEDFHLMMIVLVMFLSRTTRAPHTCRPM